MHTLQCKFNIKIELINCNFKLVILLLKHFPAYLSSDEVKNWPDVRSSQMQHVCEPTSCHHTEAVVFSVCVCFGWRAGWLVSVAVNQSLPDGTLMDRNLICPRCVITLNLPDSYRSCCSSHLSLASANTHRPTHTYVHSEPVRAAFWKPETVTETHMLNINRLSQCQEFIASICHSKASAQKAFAAPAPQRLALASDVHRPCNCCRQTGLRDGWT